MPNERWKTLLRDVAADFRRSYRQLALVHVVSGTIAGAVLGPAVTILLHWLVSTSGKSALSDLDIVFFALSPIGLITLVVVGALILTIVALELAAVMIIGFGATQGRPIHFSAAIRTAFHRAPGILRVAAEVIGRSLLVATPFLAGGGAVYFFLLGEHDINYYLSEKPPIFWVAAGLIGLLLASMMIVLLRCFSSWFFAMPGLVTERAAAKEALSFSKQLTAGRRRWVVSWLAAWVAASAVFSSISTGIVFGLGRMIVPRFASSLGLLVAVLGAVVVIATVTNFVVTFVNRSVLGLLVVRLFGDAIGGDDAAPASLIENDDRGANWRISGRAIAWGSLVAATVAFIVGVGVLRGLRLEDHTEITAHRGASAAAPENTLAAVRQAITDGADWVEIDVQETADGEVIVFHDSDFKKVAGVELKVWEATLERVQGIDIGSWFDPQFSGERAPTIGSVLDLCKGKIGVNIELKYYGHDERLEQRVVDIVEAKGMVDEVVLMSLEYGAIRKIRELRPDWTVGLLTSVSLGDVTTLDVDFLAVNARGATAAFVKSAQRSGKQVQVWTVNDALGMSQMMSRGVDVIITDEPALGVQVLRERARLSPPERLLLEIGGFLGLKPQHSEQ